MVSLRRTVIDLRVLPYHINKDSTFLMLQKLFPRLSQSVHLSVWNGTKERNTDTAAA